MILRGVLVALGFAAGIGFLIWKIVKTEMSITNDVAHDFVELKTYVRGDVPMIDEMLLRADGIIFIKRSYGRRGSGYTTLCVPREQLEKARLTLGKKPIGE